MRNKSKTKPPATKLTTTSVQDKSFKGIVDMALSTEVQKVTYRSFTCDEISIKDWFTLLNVYWLGFNTLVNTGN